MPRMTNGRDCAISDDDDVHWGTPPFSYQGFPIPSTALSDYSLSSDKMSEHHSSRLCELASTISISTSIYNNYLQDHGLPQPSFLPDAPPKMDLPPHIAKARDTILEASEELQALMLGPVGHLQRQTLDVFNPSERDSTESKRQFNEH